MLDWMSLHHAGRSVSVGCRPATVLLWTCLQPIQWQTAGKIGQYGGMTVMCASCAELVWHKHPDG